jgi:hypothetical protein
VRIGLCRAHVGIDGYSGRQLTALGRDAPSDAGVLALGRLRVRSRGLLEGGLLLRRYRFADARTARLAEAITSFPTRLEEHSVPIAL